MDHEEQTGLKDFVSKLLDRAPADDRTILVLKELEDFSVDEIAQTLSLKPTTVKVRLHRARKRMLEDLQQWRKEGSNMQCSEIRNGIVMFWEEQQPPEVNVSTLRAVLRVPGITWICG